MRTTTNQLWKLSEASFRLPHYVGGDGNVVATEASNIPIFRWPDGRWCPAANTFMRELFERGLSRRDRGGTLATYAANVGHLLRFCHARRLELHDLTDDMFSNFISELLPEKTSPSRRKKVLRDSNRVIAIGRTCVELLVSVGNQVGDHNFVGPRGRIRVTQREYVVSHSRSGSGKPIVRKYWQHRSFPTPDPKKKRFPIGSKLIEKLRESVLDLSGTSIYLRKRRYVMLRLLEITGGRRGEICRIACSAVRRAAAMNHPLLEVATIKRRGGRIDSRLIPVSRTDLIFLVEFIEKNRARVVRCTCGARLDDDTLLISETTGFGLRPNTITQEVSDLAKRARIEEKACAHMFRHRYITKLLVALIEQHEANNPDNFRKLLLNSESIKRKVLEFTGQKSIFSLEPYIDMAFDEISNFQKTYDIVRIRHAIDSFISSLDEIRLEFKNATSSAHLADTLEKLVDALRTDLLGETT